MNTYTRHYGIGLLDDLHNYFPAFLYNQTQFTNVQDVFNYMNSQLDYHFNLFNRGYREYNYFHWRPAAPAVPPVPASTTNAASTNVPLHSRVQPPQVPTTTTRTTNQTFQGTGGRRNRMDVTTTETIDITPLFTTVLPTTNRTTVFPTTQTTLNSAFTNHTALSDLLNLFNIPISNSMEPVIVRPTQETINATTSLRAASVQDEQEMCSVCQDHYTEGQALRTIRGCGHVFHKACIDQWFDRNVHCPVCRADIREQDIHSDDDSL